MRSLEGRVVAGLASCGALPPKFIQLFLVFDSPTRSRVAQLLQSAFLLGRQLDTGEERRLLAFDGLSAAAGRLYLATGDAKVICFGSAAGGVGQ